MKIWPGTSATRPDPQANKSPDGSDWSAITKELRATQEYLLNLTLNADEMPDLVADIQARQKQLNSLKVSICQLTVPEDIMLRVKQLEEEMVKLHSIYTHAAEVLETVQFLQRQLLNLGKQITIHVEETERKHISFVNQVANWQRTNEERWITRLDSAEEQLGAIALALGLKKFGE